MKHVGTYRGTRLILLGYNKNDDTIAVLNPAYLTETEREWLEDIVTSDYAQRYNYLAKALNREYHNSGTNAWLWAIGKTTQRLPAYEVSVSDIEQANAWRGSGGVTALDRTAAREAQDAGIALPEQRTKRERNPQPVPAAAPAAPSPELGILISSIQSLTASVGQIGARLTDLEKSVKVNERVQREAKKNAKKPAAPKPVAKPAAPAPATAENGSAIVSATAIS